MRLTPADLAEQGGEDAMLLHFTDTAFLNDPGRVGVAVSGGGDSMALLHVACRWMGLSGAQVEAVTVDHGLRPEAAEEAAMVASFCAERGVPHSILQWDGSKAEGNLQAAARAARYSLIADWAKGRGITHVLLGHTVDDVAETFVMRLARKAGVDGLSLMEPRFFRNDISWARPFWQQSRAELRAYLQRHGVAWAEDPSNADLAQQRPKARQILQALAPLGIDAAGLKTTALAMSSARTALEHYALEETRRIVTFESGDVLIPERPRPPVPREIMRRLYIAAIRYISGAKYPPRESALINLDAAFISQDRHTIGGCIVNKKDGVLRFTRELNATEGPLSWGNRSLGKMWDGRWLVTEQEGTNTKGALTIRALGEAISEVPDWRSTGLPKASLVASPSVWRGGELLSAPLAGHQNGFEARIVADFTSFLVSR